MPQDPAAALSALLRSSSIEDHEEILKAANAAIKADKSDFGHQHTRIIALLKLDRFDDALRAIAEGGIVIEAKCALAKAYALYKTGKLEDAASVLKAVGLADRSFQHVAAQVAYRAERFDETREIYQKMLDNDVAGEENDLNINIKAAIAQGEWQGTASSELPVDHEELDTFEVCYNVACYYIAQGDLSRAAELLKRAVKLCDASDDLTEEDKEAEMQPILAQQAYVYAKLGKVKESLDLLTSLGPVEEDDVDLKLVTENNRIALDSVPANPYLVQRKAAALEQKTRGAKLFKFQSDIFTQNSFLTDLQAQKLRGVCARTKASLEKSQSPSIQPGLNAISVINAAAEVHGKTGKALLRALESLSEKRATEVGLVLTVVQTKLQHGRKASALFTLSSFLGRLESDISVEAKDVRFSPGLVALYVSLLREQGRETYARGELAKASKHWLDRPGSTATSLLREAGIELLRSSNSQDLLLAGSAFEKLFDEHQGSHIAAAGLVASLATSDPAKVQQHVDELPNVKELIVGIDVEKLLASGVVAAPRSTLLKKRAATDADADKKATKKRRRKLPKNYEEGKKPDPERWLPLRDRSSYRPKGKKGRKKVADSTQGGIVKEEETLDLVGGGGVKVEKAPTASTSSKKKKKGKK
ncbi:unnamed protein product [Clonostachys rosea]|uniref:Signal recognition particle subunit SRP72 n=1 Tax=Bionectria ochroleuca TaxID=29856 RepID=A0ABY6URV9_BIOOC|nr:unnamed protein product [Clonostachys rosea]